MKRLRLPALVLCLLLLFSAAAHAAEPLAKYVFLFVGDGMGINQMAAASYMKAAQLGVSRDDALGLLSFTGFDHIGLMSTHSADEMVTDSAAAITAMATGHKANNGSLNMDPVTGRQLTPVSQTAHEHGYAIGIISSASLDHATPAGFYAHSDDRYQYDRIAEEGVKAGFIDFWAGGGFYQEQDELLKTASERGYLIADTPGAIRALEATAQPVIAIAGNNMVSPYMLYEMDRVRAAQYGGDDVSLAELTQAAIRVLNDRPFFMLCEAAKVDMACSGYDPVAAAHEVAALDDAVKAAVAFAALHPDETLIVVLADHETGGERIQQDADYEAFALQRASSFRFHTIMNELYAKDVSFDELIQEIAHYFTIEWKGMSKDERAALETAFQAGIRGEVHERYEDMDPVVYEVMQMIARRTRVKLETQGHSGQPVPVYAFGAGAELFGGVYDNTQIYHKLCEAMGL